VGYWYLEQDKTINPKNSEAPTSFIDYQQLRQTVVDIPSQIPLHENTEIREKFVGYDQEGHKIYRVNISNQVLNTQSEYDFYKSELIANGWQIKEDQLKVCTDSVWFCPEWILIEAAKEEMSIVLSRINNRSFIQWNLSDVLPIKLTIDSPLDKKIFTPEFRPDLILIQTGIPTLIIYLEKYEPLSISIPDHQNLFVNNEYSRCSSGVAAQVVVYSCSTEDQHKEYLVSIISSEIYTFDLVTIRYTER
jgi:hypothetical protein